MDKLQEGLQHDTTFMADRMPGNIWCRGKHHQIPQEHNAQLEDNFYMPRNQINIGQHQRRDSPLPLLFIVAMTLVTMVLERMEVGYQLEKGGSRINHLMFMDGIKLFRERYQRDRYIGSDSKNCLR